MKSTILTGFSGFDRLTKLSNDQVVDFFEELMEHDLISRCNSDTVLSYIGKINNILVNTSSPMTWSYRVVEMLEGDRILEADASDCRLFVLGYLSSIKNYK